MAISPIILIAYGGSNLQQVLLAHSLELKKLANQVFGFVGGSPGPYHRKLVFLDRSNQKIAISQNIEDLIMDFTSILHPGDRFKEPFERKTGIAHNCLQIKLELPDNLPGVLGCFI